MESETVDRGSMIATINMYSARVRLLDRVVLALYYVLHTIRDGMHTELTVLQKQPVFVEQSYLVPQTPQTPLHIEQMEGGREGGWQGERKRKKQREGEGEGKGERGRGKGRGRGEGDGEGVGGGGERDKIERGRGGGWEGRMEAYLVPQTPQTLLHVEQMEGGREDGRERERERERGGGREGGRERGRKGVESEKVWRERVR